MEFPLIFKSCSYHFVFTLSSQKAKFLTFLKTNILSKTVGSLKYCFKSIPYLVIAAWTVLIYTNSVYISTQCLNKSVKKAVIWGRQDE